MLELDIVVVVEVVDTDNLLTLAAQALDRMKTDETGCTGDQNRHTTHTGNCAVIGARLLIQTLVSFMCSSCLWRYSRKVTL
ncbi:hypothetical protein [Pseudomonas baetica]|uniref:hypothetical protein n=1 Tax=Pseudomonas baetica TaxID=674054 RepID=UPI002404EFCC|nr:hypothetical protein [Pseudomonas baetica]MDF9778366.1 hypothetical protein [Pseudomonas baetica]